MIVGLSILIDFVASWQMLVIETHHLQLPVCINDVTEAAVTLSVLDRHVMFDCHQTCNVCLLLNILVINSTALKIWQ